MLFLSQEYQLLIVVVLIFSSYLTINALTIRHQPKGMRAFSLNFLLPLILTLAAFLTATYHMVNASAFLVLGHLFLILSCTLVLLFPEDSKMMGFFFVLPFMFLIISFLIAKSPLYQAWLTTFFYMDVGLILIDIALIIHNVIQGHKRKFMVCFGLFMMAASMGIWLLVQDITYEALAMLALGYILCTFYIYKSTLGAFLKDYHTNKEALDRMNASIHAEVMRRVEEIERSNRKLLETSKTDSMTGLYIKSAVIKTLDTLLERTPHGSLSVVIFDIDNFKQINDNMGHQIGDRCVKTIATLAKTSFRSNDILGRYGGDEFIVLLPGTTPAKAYLIADRFRQLVQSKSSPQFTISAGIASFPEDAGTSELLIEAADKALYISKQKGRNQITLYSQQTKE